MLKKLYYTIFPHYKVLETKFVTYAEGDKMIRETHDKPEAERWVLAKEEDTNQRIGMVYLCRKERIKGFEKVRIVKKTYAGTTFYQIQQRHFIFFWWWVAGWVNSSLGASAPTDTFETLKEAEENLHHYDGTKATEEVVKSV